jgi:hypothetical protein
VVFGDVKQYRHIGPECLNVVQLKRTDLCYVQRLWIFHQLFGKRVTNVANQALTILIRRESEKQLATLTANDVLVSPDMQDVSSYNFTRLKRIMSAGADAAAKARGRLQALAIPEDQYQRYLARRARPVQAPVIRSVGTQPDSTVYASAVETLFGDMAGAPLDAAALSRESSRPGSVLRGPFWHPPSRASDWGCRAAGKPAPEPGRPSQAALGSPGELSAPAAAA